VPQFCITRTLPVLLHYTYIAFLVTLYVHFLSCYIIRTLPVLLHYTYIACLVTLHVHCLSSYITRTLPVLLHLYDSTNIMVVFLSYFITFQIYWFRENLSGRRNRGRPLKRLLDTLDRNGSTGGPTPWKIHDDDYDDDGGGDDDEVLFDEDPVCMPLATPWPPNSGLEAKPVPLGGVVLVLN
jgi:hypothetical protein